MNITGPYLRIWNYYLRLEINRFASDEGSWDSIMEKVRKLYRADLTLRKSHFLKLQLPEVPHFLNFKKFRVTFAQKVWLG